MHIGARLFGVIVAVPAKATRGVPGSVFGTVFNVAVKDEGVTKVAAGHVISTVNSFEVTPTGLMFALSYLILYFPQWKAVLLMVITFVGESVTSLPVIVAHVLLAASWTCKVSVPWQTALTAD